jgi:hypothetical protein
VKAGIAKERTPPGPTEHKAAEPAAPPEPEKKPEPEPEGGEPEK